MTISVETAIVLRGPLAFKRGFETFIHPGKLHWQFQGTFTSYCDACARD